MLFLRLLVGARLAPFRVKFTRELYNLMLFVFFLSIATSNSLVNYTIYRSSSWFQNSFFYCVAVRKKKKKKNNEKEKKLG
jgi:hypothetical protein